MKKREENGICRDADTAPVGKTRPAARVAFVASLPVLAGYLFLGIGFGVTLSVNGYGLIWAVLMSVFIYSGSMQYLAVGLLADQASLLTTALTSLMVNIRHLFYGISVIDLYCPYRASKPYMLFALTDENYSLICGMKTPSDVDPYAYYFYITLFDHLYWIAGSALGSLIGGAIPFNSKGIDFALTALFVTIFVDQWTSDKKHFPAITGVLVTVVCLVIFGSRAFLVPSMLLITLALTLHDRFGGKEGREDGE